MKHVTFALLIATLCNALPLFAEDAQALPEHELVITIAPIFSIATKEWNNSRELLFINAGLALEYGIANWISLFAQWIPGVNLYSSLNTGDYGYFNDLNFGLRTQIIGTKAPVKREDMRLLLAAQLAAPLPTRENSAGEPDNHLWGSGLQIDYDYVFNAYFFLSLHTQAMYFPAQPSSNINFGPGNRRVDHPLEVLVQLEPHGSWPLKDGAVVLKGSLPLTYGMSLESKRENVNLEDDSHNFSMGPVFTVSFTQFKVPFDVSLQYRAAVFGTRGFAAHDITLSGTIHLPLVELFSKKNTANEEEQP